MGKKVSIIMMAYCHEPFIRQALESVLMQQVDFDYELLVGDDCSPDNTAQIIRELEPRFAGKMKPVLREKNIGAAANGADLLSRVTGEYIAFLEGDDFWIDPHKLQKQVDFLDTHPDYMACYHKNQRVDIENHILDEVMPDFPVSGDYTLEHYNLFPLPGQTATAMLRADILRDLPVAIPRLQHTPEDRLIPLAALLKGKIYCSDEVMSAYRTAIGSDRMSWSKKFGMQDAFGNRYFFKMHRELERLGKSIGLHIHLEIADNASFYEALEQAFFKRRVAYLPNIPYIFLCTPHKSYVLRHGGKQFWTEGIGKVKRKLNLQEQER